MSPTNAATDIVERLKDYARFPLIGRGTRGRLIRGSMIAAAAEIASLRAALARLAIVERHRMASGGGTVLYGMRCNACDTDSEDGSAVIPHKTSCPLAAVYAEERR